MQKKMNHKIPKKVKQYAARGLHLNQFVVCKNSIGVKRARQLVNNKTVSDQVVKKMFAYLSRARTYYTGNVKTCGTVSYLLWGGLPAYFWTKKIIHKNKKK